MRPFSSPPADAATTPASVVAPTTGQSTPVAAAVAVSYAPILAAPTPRRYDTRFRPTPPSPSHPRPFCRAPTSKEGPDFGLGRVIQFEAPRASFPTNQGPVDDFSLDLSPSSIIRRPIFHCSPIAGNAGCSTKEVHNETFYDFPAFTIDPELSDSIRLV